MMDRLSLTIARATGRFTLADDASRVPALRHAAVRAVTSDAPGAPLQVCVPDALEVGRRRVDAGLWSGEESVLTGRAGGVEIAVGVRLLDLLPGAHFWCRIRNARPTALRLHRIDPLFVAPEHGGAVELCGDLARHTFLTHAGVGAERLPQARPPLNDATRALWDGMGVRWIFPPDVIWDSPDWLTSLDIGGLYDLSGRAGWLGGFIGPGEAFGEIGARARGAPALFLSSLMDGVLLEPGESRRGERAILLAAPAGTALRAWTEAVTLDTPPRRRSPPLPGWCSWYQLGSHVSKADVRRAIAGFRDLRDLDGVPVDTIQIDEGFERAVGDWEANDRFPGGMKRIAGEIAAAGFRPGLWLAPTMVHESVPLTGERPDLFQRTPSGDPAIHFGTFLAWTRILDPTHPETLELIGRMIRKAVREWGYTYLKIDFTYLISRAAVFYDPRQTTFQMHRALYRTIRESAGDDAYIMACVGEAARYTVGLVDAARIGGDQAATWVSIRDSVAESIARTSTQGVWWHNDPDVFYLRAENSALSPEESRFVATATSMLGGLTLTSDFPDQWDTAARDIFRRIVPPCPTGARVVNRASPDFPPVYVSHHATADGPWASAATLNWSDAPAAIDVDLAEIALDPAAPYHAYELWEDRYLGVVSGRFTAPMQPPHSARVWIMRPARAGLHLIASTFHVSGGAVEIAALRYAPEGALEIDLVDIAPRGVLVVAAEREPRLVAVTGADGEVRPVQPGVWRVFLSAAAAGRRVSLRLEP